MSGADVLAVMDAAIDHVTCPAAVTLPTANGLREARAAVAELIEADVEYDAAQSAYVQSAPNDKDAKAKAERFSRADDRRREALARVQGGSA